MPRIDSVAFVDDRNVGELKMRMQGVVRCDRRFDHGGKAHARIQLSRCARGPAGIRERRQLGPALRRMMIFRQQQARRVHVGAGDMRVNVDPAGHDDLAADVVGRVGPHLARRRRDDAAIADPDVAGAVPLIDGVDHVSAGKTRQHVQLPGLGNKRCDVRDDPRDRRRIARFARRKRSQRAD